MIRYATVKKTFSYRPERGQNPYMGFTDFQHFKGDPLYSDAVVKPENNLTETEAFECYPIPEGVPQKGRGEGFYPECSVVYLRILWKEFEPEDGVYRYEFLQEILDKARAGNQKLMFRLMPHSTRESDDVPDWLKKIIPCPPRPRGKREKASPTDPKYLEYLGRAIRKLGERFDADSTLAYLDISLTGAWGEGSHRTGFRDEDLKKLVDVYTQSFPNTQLIGQIMEGDLLAYANETCPVGWRADGVGHPNLLKNLYPKGVEPFSDLWKTAPVALESYWWLGEWKRQGWSLDDIINTSLAWHISLFNGKSLPIPWEWKDRIDFWLGKMGYHFRPLQATVPERANPGDTLQILFTVENRGVAPVYRKIPLHLRLKNGDAEYEYSTQIDIRTWLPGSHFHEEFLPLPHGAPTGEYAVQIGIFDEEHPHIYLCTDGDSQGAYYQIGTVTVTLP